MPILDSGRDEGRTAPQISRLFAIARENGIEPDDAKELIRQYGCDDPFALSRESYDDLCDHVLPHMTEAP